MFAAADAVAVPSVRVSLCRPPLHSLVALCCSPLPSCADWRRLVAGSALVTLGLVSCRLLIEYSLAVELEARISVGMVVAGACVVSGLFAASADCPGVCVRSSLPCLSWQCV